MTGANFAKFHSDHNFMGRAFDFYMLSSNSHYALVTRKFQISMRHDQHLTSTTIEEQRFDIILKEAPHDSFSKMFYKMLR